jgi:signal transduction histidine kinase
MAAHLGGGNFHTRKVAEFVSGLTYDRIPAEVRDRIFDPFFTTKPLGQGTGLGLDIARRLARHNDGTIDFESHPGHTEFRVTLPIAGDQSS